MWKQFVITLKPKKRDFHLVTDEIVSQCKELKNIKTGMANLFLQHTSASLCLNENADPSVRKDFESFFRNNVQDGAPYFRHTLEGYDDMTAHLKSAILGVSLNIPIKNGAFALGIWQGIYLGEHRENAGVREILVTLFGEGE
ncbi:MAG: hypothetical protein ACD_79C00938G0006 [uncultured bacterium]|nr:MAG: hypothetical protein ACD_79C00938G0006 [uncultured bacterium]